MRPIDADALRRKICAACEERLACTDMGNICFEVACIDDEPTIEAEPVRHAYWEPSEVGEYHCTNCGVECDIDEFHKALLNSFCGNCGARMDGGDDND